MALTNLTGSVAASVNIKLTDSNYNQPSSVINQPVNQAYAFGTGTGQADLLHSVEVTIAPSGTETFDLDAGTLTDIFGNLLTFVNVKMIRVQHAADSAASSVNLAGDFMTTNFGASFSKPLVPGAISFDSQNTTGYAVTATTGDAIDILNNDGSNSAIVTVDIIGTSA